MADKGGGMSASCKLWVPSVAHTGQQCGSHCSLKRAMDGYIVRCDIISSCHSAATSKIVDTVQAFASTMFTSL